MQLPVPDDKCDGMYKSPLEFKTIKSRSERPPLGVWRLRI